MRLSRAAELTSSRRQSAPPSMPPFCHCFAAVFPVLIFAGLPVLISAVSPVLVDLLDTVKLPVLMIADFQVVGRASAYPTELGFELGFA